MEEQDKRNREHNDDQDSGHASNRFSQKDDTNIGLNSAYRVDKRRKKKKIRKNKSSGGI